MHSTPARLRDDLPSIMPFISDGDSLSREVDAPVPLPAFFRRLSALGTVLPIRNGGYPIRRNSKIHQEALGCGGATIAETEIVLFTSALIAMAFEDDGGVGMRFQYLGIAGQCLLGIGADIRFV
jgi:hypothetical protein